MTQSAKASGSIQPSIVASILVVAVIVGLWLYMVLHRIALDREIVAADRIVSAEAARAPFTTLAAYDAAEKRAVAQIQRESMAGIFPLEAVVREARMSWHKEHMTPAWAKAHDMTVEMRGRAEVAEAAAAEAQFKDKDLNFEAMRATGEWRLQLGQEELAKAAK